MRRTGTGLAHLPRVKLILSRQHLVRGPMGNQLAREHQRFRKILADRVHIVQHGNHRSSFAMPIQDDAQEIRQGARVNRGKGLIQQHKLGILQQESSEQRAL